MKPYSARIMHYLSSLIRKKIANVVRTEIIIEKYKTFSEDLNFRGITEQQPLNEPIIISLTTYGKRIFDVYLVIESIMRQTIQANKIILWLDEEEFNNETLPIKLHQLKQRGLTISYCKDYKSYKKIIPTLLVYPNTTIITIDDDVIYPYYFIEELLKEYKKNNTCIFYYRGREIIESTHGRFKAYFKWPFVKHTKDSFMVLPTGIGGILYPKNCFDIEVTDEKLWSELCPKGDDIWLRIMTMTKGYKCKKINISGTFEESFISLENNQDMALANSNYYNNSNDLQIAKAFNYFSDQILPYKTKYQHK